MSAIGSQPRATCARWPTSIRTLASSSAAFLTAAPYTPFPMSHDHEH